MSSIYSQLAQDLWYKNKPKSEIESLMQTYEAPRDRNDSRSRSPTGGKTISRMTYEEERYEREMLNIRNFGFHWIKPIGITKTMGQAEDEARETQDSYEEFEDEDGEFNQNDPEMTGVDADDPIARADEELEGGEEDDLDQDIEEGASFDAGDTSFVSSVPVDSPRPNTAALYTTIDGQPYMQRPDGALVPTQSPQSLNDQSTEISDQGLSSAEEGSVGDYSSDDGQTEPDST